MKETTWRHLDEYSKTPEFEEFIKREFPQERGVLKRPMQRREFLKLMGSMVMMAGLAGCAKQPLEKIIPYVKRPEDIIPGKPLYFATAMTLGGFARGLLVESHMGRPTKAEGNPGHPDSLGATDVFAQGSVFSLYDPDRSRTIGHRGISTWQDFNSALKLQLKAQKSKAGSGLRILTETITSPTLGTQIKDILQAYPEARWHQYDPESQDAAREGSRMVWGEVLQTRYDLKKADVVLSLDADFLSDGPGALRYTREFTSRRRLENNPKGMNRLYAIESSPGLAGSMADHRLSMKAGDVVFFAAALAKALGLGSFGLDTDPAELSKRWIKALASDLSRHKGSCLIIPGAAQPASVHALAHVMNHVLANSGKTVIHTDAVEAAPQNQIASLRELAEDLNKGKVDTLIIVGGNPAYTAPVDLDFKSAMQKAEFSAHLSLYRDETSHESSWHIPEAHFLESWGDARSLDGTATLIQPLIAPLYNGKSAYEFLSLILSEDGRSSHDLVKDFWKAKRPSLDFERFWEKSLHDGFISQTASAVKSLEPKKDFKISAKRSSGLELIFKSDPTIGDGRFANNGWLQETPKPFTKLTWDNAALMSPKTAGELGLKNENQIELRLGERAVAAPVWILPGQAEGAVTLHLGYGRTHAGQLGNGGVNAYALRDSLQPGFASGLKIQKKSGRIRLATTQKHHDMENRHLIRSGTLAEYKAHPDFAQKMSHDPKPNETLYGQPHKKDGYQWGMAIDLNACTGCNACVVACQSENNTPVVGKEQVLQGREMHWMRVDQYYKGDLNAPQSYQQPVMCMHCENAPCEPVCPVGATVHSDEGLNEMVYNRCVGTRYCSNNCPYKVRRFNFFGYTDKEAKTLKMARNPDVTVRNRGVMEKCTYCVQRINHARIQSKNEDRDIRDGEVISACQQVCPAEAIVFGNINDPNSKVSKLKSSSLNYGLLTDLNTLPRSTYLAQVKNPNPELG